MLECSSIGVCAFKASEVLLKFVGELTFPLQQNALLILQDGSNHDVCCSLPCEYLLEINYRMNVIYYKLYTCGSKGLLQGCHVRGLGNMPFLSKLPSSQQCKRVLVMKHHHALPQKQPQLNFV